MFELNQEIMDNITLNMIFDNKNIDDKLQAEIEDLLRYRHNGLYSATNTNKNMEYVLSRPDITLTMALTNEILKQRILLKYTGVNLTINARDYFDSLEETIKNLDAEKTFRLLDAVIGFKYQSERLVGSQNCKSAIVFANCIRGQSFLTKFKKIDLSKIHSERYQIQELKELELDLLDGRMDNTMVIKICDMENYTTVYYVLTNKYNWKKVRKMVGRTTTLFPELVVQDVNEDFKNKIDFLGEKLRGETNDNSAWQETFFSIINDETRRQNKIIIEIEKLLENTKRQEIYNLERRINNYKGRINSCEADIREFYNNIRELEGKLLRIDQDPELKAKVLEVLEFTNKSKLVGSFTINADDNKATLVINAPIKYYDQSYAKALHKNLVGEGTRFRKDDIAVFKQLVEDLFITEKYTLMTSYAVNLYFYREGYGPIYYNIARNCGGLKYIGQPHLDGYACLGNNQIEAKHQCENFDLLGLVNLFTNCAQNFNLTDSAVFSHFKDDILYSADTVKTIKDNETGELLSFKDYYERIKNKPLLTQKAMLAHTKYGDSELSAEELDYVYKGFTAIKDIYVPAKVALQIAKRASGNGLSLTGPSASTVFYHEVEQREETINFVLIDNKLTVTVIKTEYYRLYDEYCNTGNAKEYNCYTALLDDYYNTETTDAISQETADAVATELAMPF
jgi:hypothetical protein